MAGLSLCFLFFFLMREGEGRREGPQKEQTERERWEQLVFEGRHGP